MGAIGRHYRMCHLRLEHDDSKCLSPALGPAREALLLPLPQAQPRWSGGLQPPQVPPGRPVEPRVWDLISGLLKDPGRLKAGLEEMIEQERAGLRGDPDQEAKSWLAKLVEVDQERQQIKWFAYAAALIGTGPLMMLLLGGGYSALSELMWYLGFYVGILGFAFLPVATAIAILRYRLYDIDLINRTLVYGSLTLMLALVYFGA